MTRFVPAPNYNEILEQASEPGRVKAARRIVDKAKQNVDTDTGGYEKSLRVVVDSRGVVAETTDFAGHIIEWGSSRQSPQSPLRRAGDSVGRLEPK